MNCYHGLPSNETIPCYKKIESSVWPAKKKNRGEESTEFGGKENSKNTLINSKLKFYVKKFIAESEAGRPTGFLS